MLSHVHVWESCSRAHPHLLHMQANYRLSQLMPFLGAAEGVVYEREKAMERLGIADVDDDGLSAKLVGVSGVDWLGASAFWLWLVGEAITS